MTVGIDWISGIWHYARFDQLGQSVLGIPKDWFTKVDKRKLYTKFNKCYEFGAIQLFVNEERDNHGFPVAEGCALELSGEGCRQLETILEKQGRTWQDFFAACYKLDGWNHFHVTRLDIAIDDRNETPYFTLPQLIHKARKEEYLCRSQTFDIRESRFEETVAQTLYIGSPKSELRYRFYEKHKEQAKKTGLPLEHFGSWIRTELEMRKEIANEIASKMGGFQLDFHDFAFGLLGEKLRFVVADKQDPKRSRWKTWRPWERFLGDVQALKLEIDRKTTTLWDTEKWLREAVAPAIKLFQLLEDYDSLGDLTGLTPMLENARLSDELVAKAMSHLTALGKEHMIPYIKQYAKNPSYV